MLPRLAKMTSVMGFIRPAGLWEMFASLGCFTIHVELYNVLWSLYNIKHPCKNLPDLWKPPDLWSIICSYRIADIVERWTAMVKITRRVDLYKYLWSLYNIKQPCRNHQTRAPYTLSTVQVRPCIRRSALEKFTSRVDFIRCRRLCIIFTRLAEITGLVDFIRSAVLSTLSTRLCGFYNIWASLYNINRRCRNSQACGLNVRSGGLCINFTGVTDITGHYKVWSPLYNINQLC